MTLHHDPDMQHTRKHKYRINSVVASSSNEQDFDRETNSLDSLSHLIRFRRSSNTDSERTSQSGSTNNKRQSQHQHTPKVVLKRHVVFDDDFTSVARVHTPTNEMSLVEGPSVTPPPQFNDEIDDLKHFRDTTTGV